MKLSIEDFHMLRWNIAAFCSALLISLFTLYLGNEYAANTLREQRTARNQLNDARNRLQSAQEDQQNMAAYAQEYGTLKGFGIIGDEQRLDWMEGLAKLRQQHLVHDFRYSIAPQKNLMPQPPVNSGNFDIRYSEIRFQFELLHEGQLLNFFTALRSQLKGWYQLEGCSLQRLGSNDDDDDDDDAGKAPSALPQIKAECTGGWITLKNRNAQP